MRDAIVISGWNWETCNVPERIALALAHTGRRVLYCDNPVSMQRRHARSLTEVENGLFALGLEFVGQRVNYLPKLSLI